MMTGARAGAGWRRDRHRGRGEAKRSRVRGTATATSEDVGRGGEESKEKGMGPKRGGGAAVRPVPINDMDLLYETKEDKMVCRMCWYVLHHRLLCFSIS